MTQSNRPSFPGADPVSRFNGRRVSGDFSSSARTSGSENKSAVAIAQFYKPLRKPNSCCTPVGSIKTTTWCSKLRTLRSFFLRVFSRLGNQVLSVTLKLNPSAPLRFCYATTIALKRRSMRTTSKVAAAWCDMPVWLWAGSRRFPGARLRRKSFSAANVWTKRSPNKPANSHSKAQPLKDNVYRIKLAQELIQRGLLTSI